MGWIVDLGCLAHVVIHYCRVSGTHFYSGNTRLFAVWMDVCESGLFDSSLRCVQGPLMLGIIGDKKIKHYSHGESR
jgi:hypothetical protein